MTSQTAIQLSSVPRKLLFHPKPKGANSTATFKTELQYVPSPYKSRYIREVMSENYELMMRGQREKPRRTLFRWLHRPLWRIEWKFSTFDPWNAINEPWACSRLRKRWWRTEPVPRTPWRCTLKMKSGFMLFIGGWRCSESKNRFTSSSLCDNNSKLGPVWNIHAKSSQARGDIFECSSIWAIWGISETTVCWKENSKKTCKGLQSIQELWFSHDLPRHQIAFLQSFHWWKREEMAWAGIRIYNY